jgi:tRNA(fMet)-specific endonuclease VapC
MKYMLDTNFALAVSLASNPMARDRMSEQEEGAFVMSAISFAELAYGSRAGKPPRLEELNALTDEVPVVAFDARAAHAYSDLPLRRNSYDRLIAAHALSLHLTLITANLRDFADVPGLTVEDWSR